LGKHRVYESENKHDEAASPSDSAPPLKIGIGDELKKQLVPYFMTGAAAGRIIRILKEKGTPAMKLYLANVKENQMQQIQGLRTRTMQDSSYHWTLLEVRSWCQCPSRKLTKALQDAVETKPDELLIVSSFEVQDKDGQASLGLVGTSKCFIGHLEKFLKMRLRIIAGDGTYKLHRHGWTLILIGFYRRRWNTKLGRSTQSFVCILILFSRSECTAVFEEAGKALLQLAQLAGLDVPSPILHAAQGDCCPAFLGGLRTALSMPALPYVMCNTHMWRNLLRQKCKLKEKDYYEDNIRPDIQKLENVLWAQGNRGNGSGRHGKGGGVA